MRRAGVAESRAFLSFGTMDAVGPEEILITS